MPGGEGMTHTQDRQVSTWAGRAIPDRQCMGRAGCFTQAGERAGRTDRPGTAGLSLVCSQPPAALAWLNLALVHSRKREQKGLRHPDSLCSLEKEDMSSRDSGREEGHPLLRVMPGHWGASAGPPVHTSSLGCFGVLPLEASSPSYPFPPSFLHLVISRNYRHVSGLRGPWELGVNKSHPCQGMPVLVTVGTPKSCLWDRDVQHFWADGILRKCRYVSRH